MMRLVKRTYSLPPSVVTRFEGRVEPGKRSATLARVLQGWIEDEDRRELRAEIQEGLREVAEEYLAVAHDLRPLDEEVDRGIAE